MENFNNVPSSGTFGSVVSVVNQNFALAKEAIDKLAFSKSACVGFYETSSELNDAHPTPTDGDWALVGNESPFNVYVANDGSWVDSGVDYNVSVDNSIEINGLGGYVVLDSVQELPASPSNPNLGYLIDTHLYVYVGTGGDTLDGKYKDCGEFKGSKGDNGNGIVSIAKTSTSGLIDTYTITYTDGSTSTFTVTNGKNGENGVSLGEVGIADNLTTNDATKVLSAKQGAVLQSRWEIPLTYEDKLVYYNNGSIASNGGWTLSNAIDVVGIPYLILNGYFGDNGSACCGVACYKNGTYSKTDSIRYGNYTFTQFTIPSGVTSIRLCGKKSMYSGKVYLDGSTVYQCTLFGSAISQVQTTLQTNIDKTISIPLDTYEQGYINTSGNFAADTGWSSTPHIFVGGLNKLYLNGTFGNRGAANAVSFYDNNKVYISGISVNSSSVAYVNYEVTIPSGAMFVRACCAGGSGFGSNRLITYSGTLLIALNDFPVVLNANRWRGKKVNFLGDSITQPSNGWWYWAAKYLGITTARNYGISNSTIAKTSADSTYNPMVTRYANMDNDADFVVVIGSRNDYRSAQVPLGNESSTELTTFWGAMKELVNGLINKYPLATIVFATMYRARCGENLSTSQLDSEWQNSQGLVQDDYNEVIRKVCRSRAVPVIDLYYDGMFSNWNLDAAAAWFQDTVHLKNDAGYKHFGEVMSVRMLNI